MGKRIQSYFEEADRMGGLVARMRLASLAQITSTEAATIEDRPELIERMQKAIATLKPQFASAGPRAAVAGELPKPPGGDEQVRVLRRHLTTYLDLMAQRSLFLGDVEATLRRVDEAASTALAVQRVSVWFSDPGSTKI